MHIIEHLLYQNCVCKPLTSLTVSLSMSIDDMFHHWLSESQNHVLAIAVPAKYRVPSSFLQHCHRAWHKVRLAALRPASINLHLHEMTILNPYMSKPLDHKPLDQTNIIDVPQRHPEFVLAIEDLEYIVSYRARDSSKRWWESNAIRRAPLARSTWVNAMKPVQVQVQG